MTEVLKLKLLRLLLGENGQTPFDARRLNEVSSLEDALKQLNSFWGTNDNNINPLYDNEEDLLYRQYLKDLLQKDPVESRNSSTISASPLKEDVSLTAKGEGMENPRALVHAETQRSVFARGLSDIAARGGLSR